MDENERMIIALTQTVNQLTKRISPQRDLSKVHRPPARGEWSVRDIVAHLRDNEALVFAKLHMLANLEAPDLRRMDLSSPRPYSPDDTIFTVMSQFRRLRQSTLSLLRELHPDAWRRTGRDVDNRGITIRSLVEDLITHDADHLAQVDQVLIARDAMPFTVRPLVTA
jgi:hypothetical protein